MNKEFKLNEGEQITKFHKKEEYTFWEIIPMIFVLTFLITWILPKLIYKIFEMEIQMNFYIYSNLIILFLILIILYLKNVWTENSIEIHYFNDYLLITNIPYNIHVSRYNSDVKLNYESIEYFMLKEGRMKIEINDSEINESKFKKINSKYKLSDLKFYDINIIIHPRFKSKKVEFIDFLNKKLKKNQKEIIQSINN